MVAGLKPESVTHTTRLSIRERGRPLILLITSWSDVLPRRVQQRIGTPSVVTAMAITDLGKILPVVL
jgi:hypothetical protein